MDASNQALTVGLVVLSALNLTATVALAVAVWQVKATWSSILNSIRQARKR